MAKTMLLGALLAGLAVTAQATVQRCVDAHGGVSYVADYCPAGQRAEARPPGAFSIVDPGAGRDAAVAGYRRDAAAASSQQAKRRAARERQAETEARKQAAHCRQLQNKLADLTVKQSQVGKASARRPLDTAQTRLQQQLAEAGCA